MTIINISEQHALLALYEQQHDVDVRTFEDTEDTSISDLFALAKEVIDTNGFADRAMCERFDAALAGTIHADLCFLDRSGIEDHDAEVAYDATIAAQRLIERQFWVNVDAIAKRIGWVFVEDDDWHELVKLARSLPTPAWMSVELPSDDDDTEVN